MAGEGKSFTSINLALSIARELDKTVLLVDADVSRQGVSRILGIENQRGLSDILSGQEQDIADVLIRIKEPELRFLPAGQFYPNVAELLASESMRNLTQELAKRHKDRLVLFDTPPILASSEARILAGLVGQILLVVEAEHTSPSMVKEAISFLDSSKAIGLVLNKSRQKSSSAYYYGYQDSSRVSAKDKTD
jgi:exopolysaccharide/PEP-CTERM locus tyrosine autokinase